MRCPTCNEDVLTKSSYRKSEETGMCETVHTCTKCGKEIPPLIHEGTIRLKKENCCFPYEERLNKIKLEKVIDESQDKKDEKEESNEENQ